MIRGKFLDFSKTELNTLEESEMYQQYTDLDSSLHFRKKCIKEGYELTQLYPIFYQGWEMDYWGAIGTKDGQRFILETNHGSLTAILLPTITETLKGFFKNILK